MERKGSALALTFRLDTSLFILHDKMCVMSVLMVGFRLIVSWSHRYYEHVNWQLENNNSSGVVCKCQFSCNATTNVCNGWCFDSAWAFIVRSWLLIHLRIKHMPLKNDAAGPCVWHHRAQRLSQHVHVWSSQKKPLGLLSNIIIKPVSTVSPHVMRLLLFTKRNSVTSSETVSNTRPGRRALGSVSQELFYYYLTVNT